MPGGGPCGRDDGARHAHRGESRISARRAERMACLRVCVSACLRVCVSACLRVFRIRVSDVMRSVRMRMRARRERWQLSSALHAPPAPGAMSSRATLDGWVRARGAVHRRRWLPAAGWSSWCAGRRRGAAVAPRNAWLCLLAATFHREHDRSGATAVGAWVFSPGWRSARRSRPLARAGSAPMLAGEPATRTESA
jgi:hypothetical protein